MVCTNVEFHDNFPWVRLRLIDVESGNAFYDRPSFFEMNYLVSYSYLEVLRFELAALENDVATMLLSPDGRYLLCRTR